jgi:PKD repeat protein
MAEVTYTKTGDMTDALYALRDTNDGIMDNVHTLRDTYGADIVSLINEDGNYCGIAWVMTNVSNGFNTNAFNVTYSSCLSSHTLSHEIGHNEGCMHDRANSSFAGSYPYSYGHRDTTEGFRTIMSYSCSGGACPRISNFSNPSVLHNGVPTGIDHDVDPNNSADSARSKNNTASTVANWRQAVNQTAPAAPTGLLVSAMSGDETQVTWSDNADNEDGYFIERSLDGNAWQQIAATGPGASSYSDNGLDPNTMYHYRAQSYNGVGNSAYSNSDSAMTTGNSLPSAGFASNVSGMTVDFTDGSSDSDGTIASRSWDFGDSSSSSSATNPSHSYASAGTYTVMLTVTDNDGGVDSTSANVTVTAPDTTAPTITAPGDITLEATGVTTPVNLGTPSVSDDTDPSPSVSADNLGPFPIGTTTVTWTATDASGNSATDTQNVTVEDTTAPSAPGNLAAAKKKVKGSQSTKVTWNASNDTGSGVDYYRVKRNGVDQGITTGTNFVDPEVVDGTVYSVTATDMMGNVSAVSTVTYPDGGSGGGSGGGGGGSFCDTHPGHKRCP